MSDPQLAWVAFELKQHFWSANSFRRHRKDPRPGMASESMVQVSPVNIEQSGLKGEVVLQRKGCLRAMMRKPFASKGAYNLKRWGQQKKNS